MDPNIASIISLIEQSELDQTIKNILIRDLEEEGLTDYLREQIKAYCQEGIKKLDGQIEQAKKLLESQANNDQTPA